MKLTAWCVDYSSKRRGGLKLYRVKEARISFYHYIKTVLLISCPHQAPFSIPGSTATACILNRFLHTHYHHKIIAS